MIKFISLEITTWRFEV